VLSRLQGVQAAAEVVQRQQAQILATMQQHSQAYSVGLCEGGGVGQACQCRAVSWLVERCAAQPASIAGGGSADDGTGAPFGAAQHSLHCWLACHILICLFSTPPWLAGAEAQRGRPSTAVRGEALAWAACARWPA
jgi:hypothetical protein